MRPLIYSKYQRVSQHLKPGRIRLLDVGCRDGVLKTWLGDDIDYFGVDICLGPAVNQVCNIERGLPFGDASFDISVALDLLEHTDNIWFAFDELVRVTRQQIIVVLPNLYHWSLRLRYLTGREMAKYVLSPAPIEDRHRWLVSYHSAARFCKTMAEKHGLGAKEIILYGARRTLSIDVLLGLISKNLSAWAVMYVFERR